MDNCSRDTLVYDRGPVYRVSLGKIGSSHNCKVHHLIPDKTVSFPLPQDSRRSFAADPRRLWLVKGPYSPDSQIHNLHGVLHPVPVARKVYLVESFSESGEIFQS